VRREHWNQHKRAAVLWAAAAFIGLQLALGAAVESGLVNVRDNSTYSFRSAQLRRRLDRTDQPFTVVMFGSSRVMNAWKAADAQQPLSQLTGRPVVAHNFGVPAGGHIYARLSLERLVGEGVRPDLAIIEVFPPYLAAQADTELQWFAANERRSNEFGVQSELGLKRGDVAHAWHERWLMPWHTHRVALLNRIAPKLLPHELRANWATGADETGWVALARPPQTPKSVAKTRQLFGANFVDFRLGGPSCEALVETLEFCRREGIACVVVALPEGSDVRSWYSPEMQREVNQFLTKLATEHSVPVIDARDWIRDDDFADSNHLRAAGAEAFSRRFHQDELPRLVREMKPPGAIARRTESLQAN
jgi:hypothetical protein